MTVVTAQNHFIWGSPALVPRTSLKWREKQTKPPHNFHSLGMTREERKEYMKEYWPKYYQANKERLTAYQRQYMKGWLERNPDQKKKSYESFKKWKANNPERYADLRKNVVARRRMQEKNGSFTPEEWRSILKAHDHKCAYCGATENIQADHIKPLALGGANTADNLQPLCRPCNSKKGKKY